MPHEAYDRFTDRTRKVLQLASVEATKLKHDYIGTEHILLGLVHEGSGVAAYVIKQLGIDLTNVREELLGLMKPGAKAHQGKSIPQTPRAKQAIEFAVEEANTFQHNYVGSEHLLLGLLRVDDGLAAVVLTNLGLNLARAHEEVIKVLGLNNPKGEAQAAEFNLRMSNVYRDIEPEGKQPHIFRSDTSNGVVKTLLVLLLISLIANVWLALQLWG